MTATPTAVGNGSACSSPPPPSTGSAPTTPPPARPSPPSTANSLSGSGSTPPLPAGAHQHREHGELLRRQRQHRAVPSCRVSRDVQDDPVLLQHRRRRRSRPPGQRLHPRGQLGEGKRLGEVVVGAERQSVDAVA